MFFPWGGDSTRASLLWHLDTQSPVLQKAREYPSLRLAPSCTLSIRFVVAPTSARRTHTFNRPLRHRAARSAPTHTPFFPWHLHLSRLLRQEPTPALRGQIRAETGKCSCINCLVFHLCCVCNTPVFAQSSLHSLAYQTHCIAIQHH